MSRRIFSSIALSAALLLLCGLGVSAQTFGSYTPYSIFAVGDLANPGTAYNKSMAGVGIAGRSNRFINPVNPAAVTARDSLAFMADFSLHQDNKIFAQGDMRSASNAMNMSDCIISFPIWRSSAMMIGILPYSDTGYGYSYLYTDPNIIGNVGNVSYSAAGKGSIYQIFAAAGVTFWRRLSLGAEFIYHFGKLEKTFTETFSNSTYNGASNGHILQLSAPAGKFGLQYEQPLGARSSLTFGATYKTAAQLGGEVTSYRYSTGTAASDTLYFKKGAPGVLLAGEIGAGLSYRYGDKLMVEVDYSRSDWRNTGVGTREGFTGNLSTGDGYSCFTPGVSESWRAGFEYVPNRNDIRYYHKKIAYRGGVYWKKDYYLLDNNQIQAFGLTLGATLPVPPGYNGITVGMDFGQRGSLKGNMIRETYINFSIGFNLFDIWFQKHQYQ
ncbi:MAG: hypothetical protein II424_04445 [Bacteroidales bacterium]|nr:hypothetical protein [Bacteroidales bacterium]MBQ2229645.1 hypothetical protein [Bacteroidales bacterium]MBQ4026666.1 hypothetical protein [Bacteroidales bacterium]